MGNDTSGLKKHHSFGGRRAVVPLYEERKQSETSEQELERLTDVLVSITTQEYYRFTKSPYPYFGLVLDNLITKPSFRRDQLKVVNKILLGVFGIQHAESLTYAQLGREVQQSYEMNIDSPLADIYELSFKFLVDVGVFLLPVCDAVPNDWSIQLRKLAAAPVEREEDSGSSGSSDSEKPNFGVGDGRSGSYGSTGLKAPWEPVERSLSTDEPATRSYAGAGSSASVADSAGDYYSTDGFEIARPPLRPRTTYLTRVPEEHTTSESRATTESRREWRRALQAVGETESYSEGSQYRSIVGSDDRESKEEEEDPVIPALERARKRNRTGSQDWSRGTDNYGFE